MSDSSPSFDSLNVGFAELIDQLNDSVMVVDRDRRILYVNQAFERLTGYTRDEVLGQSPAMISAGRNPAGLHERMWETLLEGKPFRSIFPNRRKNGELYDEGAVISPIRGQDGQPSYFIQVGRGIIDSRNSFDAFALVANNSAIAIFVVQNGQIAFVNDRMRELTGATYDVVGQPWANLVYEDDRELALAAFASADAHSPQHEFRIVDHAGKPHWVLCALRPAHFSGGTVSGDAIVGNLIDIADRKQTEQDLKQAFSLYFATVESTADGIVVVDLNGKIVGNNTRFLEMWRFAVRSLIGTSIVHLAPTMLAQLKDPDTFKRNSGEIFSNDSSEDKRVLELADGRIFELSSKLQMIEGAVAGRVWSFRDITEQRQAEAKLLRMASFDALTGLLNRRSFQEHMDAYLATSAREGMRAAVLLLDIDHFKDINDSLGHEAGDEVIVQLAALLTEHVTGGVIGRFGGDEFAIFLSDVTPQMAQDVADRLLATIARRAFRGAGVQLPLTVSVGISCYPSHGLSVRDLISRADLAMYEAKASGRNASSMYSSRLQSRGRIQFRRDWQNRLRAALDGGLALYAQPGVNLETNDVTHYLLSYRLRDSGSSISPQALRTIAGQSGLTDKIDRWQITEALPFLKQLQDNRQFVYVTLTIDGRSLAAPDMLTFLQKAVHDAGVNPRYLVLEISNTAALAEAARGERFVESLKAIGCRIALADLGGAQAIFHRTDLPLEYLQVGELYIKDVVTDEIDQNLVRVFVGLARAVDVQTFAGGIDDEPTRTTLIDLGVDYGMGPLFGKPRLASTIVKPEAKPSSKRRAA